MDCYFLSEILWSFTDGKQDKKNYSKEEQNKKSKENKQQQRERFRPCSPFRGNNNGFLTTTTNDGGKDVEKKRNFDELKRLWDGLFDLR
ncbi:hypothetical protein CEXT_313401 [Caerostris extrusa]|uniref:Uncharacterized protein n=1 Tax=Caerostris extrusa TaxID=172846 RepID=A0AAV4Y6P9_CAEEX|nr:hypothetical protein CEXT_313401 [Caerostris extrusa]